MVDKQDLKYPEWIQINIEWTPKSEPERTVFRIYLLGIATKLSFPVIVPYRCHLGQSDRSLAIVSTRERNLKSMLMSRNCMLVIYVITLCYTDMRISNIHLFRAMKYKFKYYVVLS